jgi:hypothetical protein
VCVCVCVCVCVWAVPTGIYDSLRRRAQRVVSTLNALEGVKVKLLSGFFSLALSSFLLVSFLISSHLLPSGFFSCALFLPGFFSLALSSFLLVSFLISSHLLPSGFFSLALSSFLLISFLISSHLLPSGFFSLALSSPFLLLLLLFSYSLLLLPFCFDFWLSQCQDSEGAMYCFPQVLRRISLLCQSMLFSALLFHCSSSLQSFSRRFSAFPSLYLPFSSLHTNHSVDTFLLFFHCSLPLSLSPLLFIPIIARFFSVCQQSFFPSPRWWWLMYDSPPNTTHNTTHHTNTNATQHNTTHHTNTNTNTNATHADHTTRNTTDHAAQGRRQRRPEGLGSSRPLLLSGVAGQHRHLRCARLW